MTSEFSRLLKILICLTKVEAKFPSDEEIRPIFSILSAELKSKRPYYGTDVARLSFKREEI
jgi:hypothetical protein